jgi:hypothetical protein
LEETGKEIKKGIHEIHQKIDDVLK